LKVNFKNPHSLSLFRVLWTKRQWKWAEWVICILKCSYVVVYNCWGVQISFACKLPSIDQSHIDQLLGLSQCQLIGGPHQLIDHCIRTLKSKIKSYFFSLRYLEQTLTYLNNNEIIWKSGVLQTLTLQGFETPKNHSQPLYFSLSLFFMFLSLHNTLGG
jgi:hypothetical protein